MPDKPITEAASSAKPVAALNAFVTIVPLLTAMLYLLGACYQAGYLDGFGIKGSMFLLSFQEAVMKGSEAISGELKKITPYIWRALMCIVVLWAIAAIDAWFAKRGSRLSALDAAKRGLYGSAWWLFALAAAAVVLVCLPNLCSRAYKRGQDEAGTVKAAYNSGTGPFAEVPLSNGVSALRPAAPLGKVIICGDRYCAFWAAPSVIVLKHEEIKRVVLRERIGPPAPAP